MSAAAMGMGCVYILGNQGLSGYKIGQTSRAPETRAGEVTRSYGTAHKFEVVSKHAVEDPAIVEALAHRILHRYRIPRSELFDCNLATCKRAVKAAALLALERPWWKRLWHWLVLPRPKPVARKHWRRSRHSYGSLILLLVLGMLAAGVIEFRPALPGWMPAAVVNTVSMLERVRLPSQ